MGNGLEAGTVGGPAEHSLAGYLERGVDEVRQERGLDPLPDEGREDRTVLFLGLARGLIDYLGDHSEAFVVESHWTVDDTEDYRHDSSRDGYVRVRVDSGFPEHP